MNLQCGAAVHVVTGIPKVCLFLRLPKLKRSFLGSDFDKPVLHGGADSFLRLMSAWREPPHAPQNPTTMSLRDRQDAPADGQREREKETMSERGRANTSR